jgi:cytochrome c oxidase accessory protein FixG
MDDLYQDTESYRDHISTVDQKGKRIWLFPRKPSGRYYNARTVMTFVFLAFFLTMPFIKVHGEQFLLFNVLERKFVLFGILFTPQDFHLFALTMITGLVFITLFTVVFGRLFCGWVCPQTVFMEMIFRRIEYLVEGDWSAQRKLDAMPWNAEKTRKRILKHSIFFAIAVVVSHYFLAYIIGMDQVLAIISGSPFDNIKGFIGILVFSFVFYGVFARLREQVCTTICPYGRLQGVLLVKDSIVVAYDYNRGEPRGKLKKGSVQKTAANPLDSIKFETLAAAQHASDTIVAEKPLALGDCIDCKLCVQVCPTGIDIRNGTQLECTNCTACMDACDGVMDKIDKPRGLVRYDSATGIESGVRKIFTPRVIAYSAVLVALVGVNIFLWSQRGSVEGIVMRTKGQLFQIKGDSLITNLFNYSVSSKVPTDMDIELVPDNPAAKLNFVGHPPSLLKGTSKLEGVFEIEMPVSAINDRSTPLKILIKSNGKVLDESNTSFLAPF